MTNRNDMSRRELLRGRILAGLISGAADRLADIRKARAGRQEQDVAPAPPRVVRYPKAGESTPEPGRPADRFRRTIPVHRPPGAVDERAFLKDCTRCDACLKACPHDAIVHAPERFREAAGTPIIDADKEPCRMCDDFPCIAACEPGVLTPRIAPVMGTARIVEETCLAHTGTVCTVCSEHCPVEGAILLEECRPVVVEDRCTGCGVCRYVCPAPENAVLLMPALRRPGVSSGQVDS